MALKSANLQRLKWLGQSDHALIDGLRAAVAVLESEGLRFGQGTSDAFDDAAWLVLWGLDLPRDRLDDFRDARVSAIEWRRIAQLLRRRVEQRLPVSYLTGEAWLDGLRFRSDPRALIPRSLLVEALARCRDEGLIDAPLSMLDLCTGSGSILIHAGHQFADAQLFGS
ncbi:MAG: 50S ribosomal protein L3 N(5)-glutamine methyltransferase, partial [Betaproteobacteria bacterium]|nr:50S ribosomal protein L3 N(5)-glutamine methyltransferase [Betaproteobacteria bacterium]